MAKPQTLWAIKGDHGFYTGTWLTRRDAIADHSRLCANDMEPHWKAWLRRKRTGDSAVKVRMVEVR